MIPCSIGLGDNWGVTPFLSSVVVRQKCHLVQGQRPNSQELYLNQSDFQPLWEKVEI